MTNPTARPYGSWKSPITSDVIIAEAVSLGDIALTDAVYWTEGRPSEGGRNTIVRRSSDGKTVDLVPQPYNARTKVHEYGGGAFVEHQGAIYFSNFADQRLYRLTENGPSVPQPVTAAGDKRYADAVVDSARGRLICVCEDHTLSSREALNFLATVPLAGDGSVEPASLVSGSDFYSNPRLDPSGNTLAWLSWNHPNMPWEAAELWLGSVGDDGAIGNIHQIAGGPDESIFQPEWSPSGVLYFVSDRSGWWNLYRYVRNQIVPVTHMEAEFGAPQWVFGTSTYGFADDGAIVCSYSVDGAWRLGIIDTSTNALTPLASPYTELRTLKAGAGRAVFVGGSPTEPNSVVQYDLNSGNFEVLRKSTKTRVDDGYLSVPRAIEYPTENGLTAHAFFYRPVNRDFTGSSGERPPLIVISHGGPTSSASTAMSLGIQFWTSRGFAVLDVNYGGSTGYGRRYMQRLNGQWGIVDVDDCINGALYLAKLGEVDRDRLIIRGGSAGGFTTLAALTFHNVFKAGASYFGISDLEAFETDGHKFESRYNHSLIGPYPESKQLYWDRSPIHFVDRLSCPIILFQGLEDKVVPPNQAEMMFDAMKAKKLPVAYIPFEGEQHGFRKAENIKRSLDAELYFYSRVFGFELADNVEPVQIENLSNKDALSAS